MFKCEMPVIQCELLVLFMATSPVLLKFIHVDFKTVDEFLVSAEGKYNRNSLEAEKVISLLRTKNRIPAKNDRGRKMKSLFGRAEGKDEDNYMTKHGAVVRIDGNTTLCLGSVISHWHVLTAAHCVVNTRVGHQRSAKRLTVRLATKKRSSGGLIYKVRRWFVPVSYVRKSKFEDLAVLELDEFVEFSDSVGMVELLSLDDKNFMEAMKGVLFDGCLILGWPGPKRNLWNDVLNIPDHDHAQFSESYEFGIVNLNMSAACEYRTKKSQIYFNSKLEACSNCPSNDNICFGTTGSPLVCNSRQVGIITKHSRNEDGSGLLVYTRVDYFFKFIVDTMNKREAVASTRDFTNLSSKLSCTKSFAFYHNWILIIYYLFY